MPQFLLLLFLPLRFLGLHGLGNRHFLPDLLLLLLRERVVSGRWCGCSRRRLGSPSGGRFLRRKLHLPLDRQTKPGLPSSLQRREDSRLDGGRRRRLSVRRFRGCCFSGRGLFCDLLLFFLFLCRLRFRDGGGFDRRCDRSLLFRERLLNVRVHFFDDRKGGPGCRLRDLDRRSLHRFGWLRSFDLLVDLPLDLLPLTDLSDLALVLLGDVLLPLEVDQDVAHHFVVDGGHVALHLMPLLPKELDERLVREVELGRDSVDLLTLFQCLCHAILSSRDRP